MPIYEYKCLDCGLHVEKMQKASAEPLKICENCGGNLEKQWSLSGIQFKGDGWYVTDYSNKLKDGNAKTEKAEKTEKAATAEKSSTSESTAKPETASNKANSGTTDSKKDTVSKKE